MVSLESIQPVTNRIRRNCKRCRFDLAGAATPASGSRPREKGENCSGRTAIIAEVKMVRSRIIKIHRALHEPQTEKPDIKIEVPLWIARDRGDVMNSRDFAVHQDDADLRSKCASIRVGTIKQARFRPPCSDFSP